MKMVTEFGGHVFDSFDIFIPSKMFATKIIELEIAMALQRLWSNDVPSKVGIFGRRLLLSKLSTRAALANRGVITNPFEQSCAFCFQEV
jgi:phosphoribosyl-dephospho-CoA transferase